MDDLSAEDARKVLKADVANLIKKVRDGKNLSQAERNRLQSIATTPEGGKIDTRMTAKNITELCEILGISRPTLYKWREMEGSPTPGSDSSWSVLEWRTFMQEHDLGKASTGGGAGGDIELKARKLLVEVETKEVKLAVLKKLSIPVEKVRSFYASRVAEVVSILRNRLENELPPLLVGLDAVEIKTECSRVVDEIVESFNRGEGGIDGDEE